MLPVTVLVFGFSAELNGGAFRSSAVVAVGSKGATVINARGSGIHENQTFFHMMDIEPEKEIVMILTKKEEADALIESIRRRAKIDQPGRGVMFVQDVANVYGLPD